jgi:predicted porin
VKFDEPLGLGWSAVGRLEGGFDPLTGQLANGCVSFLQNAGITYTAQTSNADSGRCGQLFNGPAYGGVSNPLYGTLTFGRQQSFQLDEIVIYDPMTLSYAFSLIGYSGTDGGAGSTEAARWDNSVKYYWNYGPVHAGAMYAQGSVDGGIFGDSLGFDLGGEYKGFSIDAVYQKEHGAVNLKSAVNDALGATTLMANISDNTEWSVMAKYTFVFGDQSPAPAYSTKAPPKAVTPDKLTIYAGYSWIGQVNPDTPILFGDSAGGVAPLVPDNNAFTSQKVQQIYWAGAKYELSWGLSFTAAYYHLDQNSYVDDGAPCPVAGGASANNCAGSFNQGSFLVNYAFTKHLDIYSGISYGIVYNGLASGFPGTPGAKFGAAGTATSVDTFVWMTGLRIKI